MPDPPIHRLADFSSARACQNCHPTHYDEWQHSMHAYAMVDPAFRKLVVLRQAELDGQEDRFCLQCHSSIGTRSGEIVPHFRFDALSELSLEGVTCEACHKVDSTERGYNSGHRLVPAGAMHGPIADPQPTSAHRSEGAEGFETALFCGACHDVVEVNGLKLERPYAEWQASPAARAARPCQSCHMPTRKGAAASGGPERTVHDHRFVGVDVPLAEGFVSDDEREVLRAEVRALLEGCVELELEAPPDARRGDVLALQVNVENRIDAHNFPTGTTSIRQAWLEVTARDTTGRTVYRTGDLDDRGDLRDAFSETDPYGDLDLIAFHSTLVGARGEPEVLPWRAEEHFSRSIPPRDRRTYTLFVPTATASLGRLELRARVRFRTHGPHLLRKLDLAQLVDEVAIYDVASDTLNVELRE